MNVFSPHLSASEKQIENLPFLATERQGEALPLVFIDFIQTFEKNIDV